MKVIYFLKSIFFLIRLQWLGIAKKYSFVDTGNIFIFKFSIYFADRLDMLGSHGISDSYFFAIIKSVSELYERFTLFFWDKSEANRVEEKKDLNFLGSFYENINSVEVEDLVLEKKEFLPAMYFRKYSKERDLNIGKVFQFTSNGAACHYDKKQAILNGLYEIIERDSLLCFWYGKVVPEKISVSNLSRRNKKIIDSFQRKRIEIEILNLTTDMGVPTVCVLGSTVVEGEVRRVLSCATNLDFEVAIHKALLEFFVVKVHLFSNERVSLENLENITQLQRATLWQGERMEKEFSWFMSGKILDLEEIKNRQKNNFTKLDELQTLLNFFQKRNESVFVFTYPNLFPEITSLKVVKVVNENLFPFFLKEKFKILGEKRIREFCKFKNKEYIMNEYPHLLC